MYRSNMSNSYSQPENPIILKILVQTNSGTRPKTPFRAFRVFRVIRDSDKIGRRNATSIQKTQLDKPLSHQV